MHVSELTGYPGIGEKIAAKLVDHFGDPFYIRTNLKAKNFRLMKSPVGQTSLENWKEVKREIRSKKPAGDHISRSGWATWIAASPPEASRRCVCSPAPHTRISRPDAATSRMTRSAGSCRARDASA